MSFSKASPDNTFILLDVDWPREHWRGHLPNYHTYLIDCLIKAGFAVISVSPNSEKIKKNLNQYFSVDTNKLNIIDYAELYQFVEIVPEPIEIEETENISTIKRLKNKVKNFIPKELINLYSYLRKKLRAQIPEEKRCAILNTMPETERRHYLIWENTLAEFKKFNLIVYYLIKKFQLDPEKLQVFFQYLDTYNYVGKFETTVDEVFKFPWYGLWIQTKEFNLYKNAPEYCFLASKNCKGIGLLEENKIAELRTMFPNKAIVWFPDVLTATQTNESFFLAQHIKQQAKGRNIIGLLGRLNEDKGINTFLKASLIANEEASNEFFFILVGGVSLTENETLEQISKASENDNSLIYLHAINEDENFNAIFNLCDVIYAAYKNFPYSSNTLAKAALYKKPVIISENSLMQKRVHEFQIGEAINPNSPENVLNAIKKLMNINQSEDTLNFNFEGFLTAHSYKQFQISLNKLTERSL